MALDWLSAGTSILGSGIAAISGKSSSDKTAKAIKSEGKAQRAYLEKYASPLEIKGNIKDPTGLTISKDPSQQYAINPSVAAADLQLLPETSDEVKKANEQYYGDIMKARDFYTQKSISGISPEEQRMIMRNVKEQSNKAVSEGLKQTQAGLAAGQAGGGVSKMRQDQIIGSGAENIANQQFQLSMKSILDREDGITKLMALGQTEKANALQNQQLEEYRTLTNNTIKDTLRNQTVDNINRFNNLVISMKSLATQQGAAMAQTSAQTTADLIKVYSEYNGMVNGIIKNLTGTANKLWKASVLKDLNKTNITNTSNATPTSYVGSAFENYGNPYGATENYLDYLDTGSF
jgi:hypothetical protein